MESLSCVRCGHIASRIDCLRKHLTKKNLCKPLIADVPVQQALNDILNKDRANKKPTNYQCCICCNIYSTAAGLRYHRKKCFIKPINIEHDAIFDDLQLVKANIQSIQEQLALLLTNNNHVTNNIINNTVIILCDFGKENTDHIDQAILKECLINCQEPGLRPQIHHESGISLLWKRIHDEPANKSVRIKNIHKGQLEKFVNGRWIVDNKDAIMHFMISHGRTIIEKFLNEHKDIIDQDKMFEGGISDDILEYLQWVKIGHLHTIKEIKDAFINMLTSQKLA
jgi:hypothetical protein